MEVWNKINDYPDYRISSMGRVLSLKNNDFKIMRTCLGGRGYETVCLCKDGVLKRYYIHRLVAISQKLSFWVRNEQSECPRS